MSNRYFDVGRPSMDYFNSSLPRVHKAHDRVRATKQDKKDFVVDETKIPKIIFANNIFRNKLLQMQDLKNYENERDRLTAYINSKSPNFRAPYITQRIDKLNRQIYRGKQDLIDIEKQN